MHLSSIISDDPEGTVHMNTNNHNYNINDTKSINLKPMDTVNGFDIRPGFYEVNGATVIPCGVNFTISSHNATSVELVLFPRLSDEPYAIIPFPDSYRIGKVFSMIVFGLDIEKFEYAYRIDGPYQQKEGLIFNKDKFLLDPYAKAIAEQRDWGVQNCADHFYKARVVRSNFEWGNSKQLNIPAEDLIIYEMHVRGFTKHSSSGVEYPGTYQALIEKIPYLLELGVNVVELMPIFEFDEMLEYRNHEGRDLCNYWGYSTVSFFAPNTAYASKAEHNIEGNELKKLIKALNENGIEVYLDVVFNHTAEGNELGPFFSFKGLDNNVYYLLTPDGHYYNFSGCGNALNCNHPTVRRMIIDCLRYWVTEYHIDGFRFDLASILGRNQDGSPMNSPPLLQSLAYDTILADTKLIAEAWDAGGLYQVGTFPSYNRWSEWNGAYRDDIRRFLKGDDNTAHIAANRIAGSSDMYNPLHRDNASVNFLTCHDGFTLNDLYSYNYKHNEANGWHNTDGTDHNISWNCGVEGETDNENINELRLRMMKNAITTLMCSRGIPMFLAGDEFGNTQFGNNNAYCQDNEISWLDWTLKEKNSEIFDFFKKVIKFRKEHKCMRMNMSDGAFGIPDISFHGIKPWCSTYTSFDHYVGVMFCGMEKDSRQVDLVYLAANTFWEPLTITLPNAPAHMGWKLEINTNKDTPKIITNNIKQIQIPPRTIFAFVARTI